MRRERFVILALLYALMIAYASTIVGPTGLNFVPLDPGEALQRFLATPYVHNGSDQRADWMGNLTMLVPFGFLLAGSLWPSGRGRGRAMAAVAAFGLSLILILAVKYAQLFFPPRTVTLNYIMAQSIGAAVGIGLFAATHSRLASVLWGRMGGGLEHLVVALQIYTAGLVLFLLMPLDFALSGDDLAMQIGRLPDVLTALPGAGRPLVVRGVLLLASTAALVPVGMLLTVRQDRRAVVGRSVAAATARGILWMIALFLVSTLVISGSPTLVSIVYRSVGIATGAALMQALSRADLARLRRRLTGTVPLLAVAYLGLLLMVNGLLATHWLSLGQAMSMGEPRALIPGFDYYIVTKAEAAKNIVGHAVMYAPVGVMLWLRRRSAAAAAGSAVLLALIVEVARYFRPGLEGDINAVGVAGFAAWLTAALMPAVWAMLESIGRPTPASPPGVVGWRDRAKAAQLRAAEGLRASGDVERY